jgi:modulator of FtsH protease
MTVDRWSNFFVAAGGAAAALTGLLFIAVSLRPREIRHSPLMIGRARAAFYAFATITLVALLALTATQSRLVGVAQFAIPIGVIAVSARFTLAAMRDRRLNYFRAALYHAGLLLVAAGGALRALDGDARDFSAVLATGVLVLLAIALSNSWQLVLSHESDPSERL